MSAAGATGHDRAAAQAAIARGLSHEGKAWASQQAYRGHDAANQRKEKGMRENVGRVEAGAAVKGGVGFVKRIGRAIE